MCFCKACLDQKWHNFRGEAETGDVFLEWQPFSATSGHCGFHAAFDFLDVARHVPEISARVSRLAHWTPCSALLLSFYCVQNPASKLALLAPGF